MSTLLYFYSHIKGCIIFSKVKIEKAYGSRNRRNFKRSFYSHVKYSDLVYSPTWSTMLVKQFINYTVNNEQLLGENGRWENGGHLSSSSWPYLVFIFGEGFIINLKMKL